MKECLESWDMLGEDVEYCIMGWDPVRLDDSAEFLK